jgi:hypothetical protein
MRAKQEEWPGERFQCSLAFAYLGGFEDDSTVLFGRGPSRAEALDTFRGLLTEEEFYAVETAAVPQYIRSQSAADLQQVVRSGSFEERVLALTWLTLVGYNDSSESPFAVALNRISGGPAYAILEEVYADRALLLDAHRRLGMADLAAP